MSWRKEVHIISCNSWAEKLLLRFLRSGKRKNFNKYLEWKVRDELKNINASVYKVKHVSVFNCIFLLRIFHAAFFVLICRLRRGIYFCQDSLIKLNMSYLKLRNTYHRIIRKFIFNQQIFNYKKRYEVKKDINTY